MLEFISSNILLFVALGVILVFALLFVVVKFSRWKTPKVTKVFEKKSGEASASAGENKTEDKQEKPKEEKTEKIDKDESKTEETKEQTEKKETDEGETQTKKEKPKRSVEKLYKRTVLEPEETKTEEPQTSTSSISEEELLSKMEFVRSSKKVSKLVKVSKNEPLAEELETMVTDEPYLPPPEDASEQVKKSRRNYHLKEHKSHFDKSKRLSKFVEQDNFDDMFDSHISDDYLDIDVSRHLDTSEDVLTRLFDRASKTIAGSSVRLVSDDDDEEKANIKTDKAVEEAYLEKKKREIFAQMISEENGEDYISEDMKLGEIDIDESMKLDTRTILVADALINRKGKNGKK